MSYHISYQEILRLDFKKVTLIISTVTTIKQYRDDESRVEF